ncbi:MAG: RelA/SpoT family protein [Lentimicrobiaceae bacterium]|nr:RelA/SpoT family protein [Lentimicrobiaceae bacterium]
MLSEDRKEKEQLVSQFADLLEVFSEPLGKNEYQLLRNAFDLCYQTLHSQTSKSGDPYFIHSIDVARIVAKELELGLTSVICALLHDIIHKGNFPVKEIEKVFGKKIAGILGGMANISRMQTEKISLNAENFISLFLTYSEDPRIILIKLADRLHYMRRFKTLSPEMQQKILSETTLLYIPIAHRLGLYWIKTELEDLSMRFSKPDEYEDLSVKITQFKLMQERYIRDFVEPIRKELDISGYTYEIKSRTKSIPSVWNKMQKQHLDFNQVYDLFAIRIIIESELKKEKEDCWRVYTVITNIYKPDTLRLRDWITIPKLNGYESLHITVMGPRGKFVEVQIRTRRMDEEAEKGHAAHWKYKEASNRDEGDQWMRKIREMLDKPLSDEKDLNDLNKLKTFSSDVYVFTPDGDLKKLPSGATVLDFAFDIHTIIGSKCTGALVNGKIVPIKHVLKNGDKVEVITSKNQKPNIDWLNWVVSPRVKQKIKRTLKEQLFSKDANMGKDMLARKLSQLKLQFNDENINKLVAFFRLAGPLVLYQDIGSGKIDITEIKEVFLSAPKVEPEKTVEKPEPEKTPEREEDLSKVVVIINDTSEISDFKKAKCCSPVYGDEIFGFITVEKGITIHRADCPNALQMRNRYGYRVTTACWGHPGTLTAFLADIRIIGVDEVGMLSNITNLISDEMHVNIRSMQITSKGGKFEGYFTVYVKDRKQLDTLYRQLKKLKGVLKVSRMEKKG